MIDQKLTITITKIISITNSNHIFKGTDNQPTSLMTGDKPL